MLLSPASAHRLRTISRLVLMGKSWSQRLMKYFQCELALYRSLIQLMSAWTWLQLAYTTLTGWMAGQEHIFKAGCDGYDGSKEGCFGLYIHVDAVKVLWGG